MTEPWVRRALGMGETGGLLHLEWSRTLQELLIARKDWPPGACGSRIGDRRTTRAAARTIGIDHSGGFDLRGQKLLGNPFGLALTLFLFLQTAFFEKALIGDQPFAVELGLEPLALRPFGIEHRLQPLDAGLGLALQVGKLGFLLGDECFQCGLLFVEGFAQVRDGGLDFRVARGLAGGEGLAELGDLGQHLGARFRGRGGGHVERFLDGDQRVIDPLLGLVGRELQPPAGAGAAVLEGLDIGGLERAVALLQTGRQEIRDPGPAEGEGGGERADPEAVAPAFGFAALAELVEAVLQVGRGLIGHGQLLT